VYPEIRTVFKSIICIPFNPRHKEISSMVVIIKMTTN